MTGLFRQAAYAAGGLVTDGDHDEGACFYSAAAISSPQLPPNKRTKLKSLATGFSSSHDRTPKTSFYLDCAPPRPLADAFRTRDPTSLQALSPLEKQKLRNWVAKKFDLCASIRELWHKRRMVEALPTDRECINEYYAEGAQSATKGADSWFTTPAQFSRTQSKLRPILQGVSFVYEKARKVWFKCCHVGHPGDDHPLRKELTKAYEPFLHWQAKRMQKELEEKLGAISEQAANAGAASHALARARKLVGMKTAEEKAKLAAEKKAVERDALSRTNAYFAFQCKRVDTPGGPQPIAPALDLNGQEENDASLFSIKQDPEKSQEVCLRVQHKGFAEFGVINDQERTQCIQMGLDEWPKAAAPNYFNLGRPARYDFLNFKYLKERENYRVLFL
mmetsp:Transcript_19508/g.48945  ORF Transcript_19508/g.48945 Transcript_19508/m.48945 type:complete len:391 (+) Transcript_19508:112-1284(+)